MGQAKVQQWVVECVAAGMPPVRARVGPGDYLLGRDPGCHFTLDGKRVSRRHACLHVGTDGDVSVEDQGSFNGTLINGTRVQRSVLRGKEKLTLGEWSVDVRVATDADDKLPLVSATEGNAGPLAQDPVTSSLPRPPGASGPPARNTGPMNLPAAARRNSGVLERPDVQWSQQKTVASEQLRERSVSDSALYRRLTQHGTQLTVAAVDDARTLAALAKNQDATQELALRLVYKVAAELGEAQGEQDFLRAMADTLLQATRAQTVSMLMTPEGAPADVGSLTPMAVQHHKDSTPPSGFSRSVVEQALRKRMAVATENAQADERFAANKSVLSLDLRAVLAVPMLRAEQSVGVIYMTRHVPFSDAEQDLAGALGHLTALGVDRARLKQKVAQQEALRQTLERFHTPEVVEKLMEKRASSDGSAPLLFLETIQASVLFCDLCGFTSYAEKHTAAEVGALLNSYLAEMTRVVYEHRGTVDKYIGDAVMAVFGAPFPAEDDPVRAARCALAMQQAFAALMQARPSDEQLKLRIGINTGQVVAGTVGSPLRMEYTCLGDTVNVAQRLESVAAPGQVLVGKSTAEAIAGVIQVAARGAANLKGKSGAVETYEILGEQPAGKT
ncbi:MAG: adenylate/guanylate cyclase domain-containing protein [Myxococcota bacterium]